MISLGKIDDEDTGGIFIPGCCSFACMLQMTANVSHTSLDLYQQKPWEERRKHLSLAKNVSELWHLNPGRWLN